MNTPKTNLDLLPECFNLYFYLLHLKFKPDDIFNFLRNILSILQEGNIVTLDIINQELEHRNQALIKVNDLMFQAIMKIGKEHFGWEINEQSIN